MGKLSVNMMASIIAESSKNQQTRYCFILGPDASISSGVPSLRTMVNAMLEHKVESGKFKNKKEILDSLKISGLTEKNIEKYFPDIFFKIYPEGYESLSYSFFEKYTKNTKPSIGYLILSLIMKNTYNNICITTNFDYLLEDSVYFFADTNPIVSDAECIVDLLHYNIKKPIISKMHNDLFIVKRNKDGSPTKLNEIWRGFFQNLFTTITPIFIGCDNLDYRVMNMIEELYEKYSYLGKIYWCYNGDGSSENTNKHIKNLLEKSNGFSTYINDFDTFMKNLADKMEVNIEDDLKNAKEQKTKLYEEKISQISQIIKDKKISHD